MRVTIGFVASHNLDGTHTTLLATSLDVDGPITPALLAKIEAIIGRAADKSNPAMTVSQGDRVIALLEGIDKGLASASGDYRRKTGGGY